MEKPNESVTNLPKITTAMLKILNNLNLKEPLSESSARTIICNRLFCKEVADYLRYAEEHPGWINKERRLLMKHCFADYEQKRCFFK